MQSSDYFKSVVRMVDIYINEKLVLADAVKVKIASLLDAGVGNDSPALMLLDGQLLAVEIELGKLREAKARLIKPARRR